MIFLRARIFLVLIILTCVSISNAQTQQKAAAGSIAGQIKIGERGAAGIVVALTSSDMRGNMPVGPNQANPDSSARATTDGDGRYQINDVAPGDYRVIVLAPGYVVSGNSVSVQIAQGQAESNVDFTLTKGGVITGKVIGNRDQPLIGEPVMLTPIDSNGQPARFPSPAAMNFRTDDRGFYRVYGLSTGKYIISIGRGDGSGGGLGRPGGPGGGPGGSISNLQRTYYPDVIDAAQATPVEVEAGNEVSGIDIRVNSLETYSISGRVVDAEAGNPVTGVLIGHGRTGGSGGNRGGAGNRGNQGDRQFVMNGATDGISSAEGGFRIEGLTRGSYAVYVAQDQASGGSEFYSEPVPVEISTQDVSGIEIKLRRASSVSGVVVFENTSDSALRANLIVSASSRVSGGETGVSMANNAFSQVTANGSFRIAGLSPGLVSLNITDRRAPGPFSGLTILRIERNGSDLRSGLRVESGEQISGIRIVAAYGNSTIRGMVQIEGGTLPQATRLMVSARRIDPNNSVAGRGNFPAQVDANGRFQIEKLVPGAYELSVQVMGMGRPGSNSGASRQTINVGTGVQNVVIPLNVAVLMNQQDNQNNSGRGRQRGGRP